MPKKPSNPFSGPTTTVLLPTPFDKVSGDEEDPSDILALLDGEREDLYTSDRFYSLETDGSFLAMSIDKLQGYRPDITDLDLAHAGIRRGRDFVTVFNGVIQRGYHA